MSTRFSRKACSAVLHGHGALVGQRAEQRQVLAGKEPPRLFGAERDQTDDAAFE
jgi:hypothetical protein